MNRLYCRVFMNVLLLILHYNISLLFNILVISERTSPISSSNSLKVSTVSEWDGKDAAPPADESPLFDDEEMESI